MPLGSARSADRTPPGAAAARRRLPPVLGLAGLLAAGCAGPAVVLPVRLPEAPAPAVGPGSASGDYAQAVHGLSGLLAGELGLPLPREFTVFVYATRRAYAAGLAEVGGLPRWQADEIATHAVGLGQPRRVFLNESVLGAGSPAGRLGVLAHELTHLAQYELAGGRRGTSEQWLREGMADWVACWALERLGLHSLARERAVALGAVAADLPGPEAWARDRVERAPVPDWEAGSPGAADPLTHRLPFLLADELIRRHGFPAVLGYFRAFAGADDRSGNFRRAFGTDVADFEREALDALRAELDRRASVGPPAYPER